MTTAKQRLLEYKNQSEPDDYELYELKETLAAIQADLLAMVGEDEGIKSMELDWQQHEENGRIVGRNQLRAELRQAIREYTGNHQEESK